MIIIPDEAKEAARQKAREWNRLDTASRIPVDAAIQIAEASIEAYVEYLQTVEQA